MSFCRGWSNHGGSQETNPQPSSPAHENSIHTVLPYHAAAFLSYLCSEALSETRMRSFHVPEGANPLTLPSQPQAKVRVSPKRPTAHHSLAAHDIQGLVVGSYCGVLSLPAPGWLLIKEVDSWRRSKPSSSVVTLGKRKHISILLNHSEAPCLWTILLIHYSSLRAAVLRHLH